MESELRRVQLLQLKIAKEIKRICEKNDIKYFLSGGSLLGAVRHGGFIPWDDDMDFGMERLEYDRFIEAAKTDLNDEFLLQTWDTEEHYAFPFGKVMLKGTIWLEASTKDVDISHGIFVDIFPFDTIPSSERDRKKQKIKHLYYRQLLFAINGYDAYSNKTALKKIAYRFIQIISLFSSNDVVKKKYKKLIAEGHNDGDLYFGFGCPYNDYRGTMKRDWMENLTLIKFEDDFFLAPVNKEEYLIQVYGDYMTPPPVDKRTNYHGIIEVDLGKYA